MQEGTTPGKEEVELRQEQQPRATQGAVAEVESAIERRKGFRLNTALQELLFAFLASLHPRLRRRYFLRSLFPVRLTISPGAKLDRA